MKKPLPPQQLARWRRDPAAFVEQNSSNIGLLRASGRSFAEPTWQTTPTTLEVSSI
jgi:hypothetical protein